MTGALKASPIPAKFRDMQTVETRLRSEMDAIFDFLGASRSSVQLPNDVVHSSTAAGDHSKNETNSAEQRDGGAIVRSLRSGEGILRVDKMQRSGSHKRTPKGENTSPPRPQTLDMTDPRQKLLKSQLLIEKHINKLLKELEEKNGSSSQLHPS